MVARLVYASAETRSSPAGRAARAQGRSLTGLVTQAVVVLALGHTGWEAGHATRYSEGLMHTAARNHRLAMADCMVSDDVAPLGAFIWIRSRGTGALLHCQVSDLSAPQDRKRHMLAGLVELDYSSSQRMCVDFDGPWRACKVDILR